MKRVRIIFRRLNAEQIDFLSEENASYSYDENDQLYYSQTGDNITNIKYSADGYRYYKRENSTAPEFYVYDIQGKLQSIVRPVIASDDTSVFSMMYATQNYIWDNTKVLAQIDNLNGKTYYYLYNGHGDVVQIVDTAGNIVNQYDYDVWGNFITKEETIENHFTYFGQTYDETTGLYYLRARYYDPTTGRFTQQDPAEDGYNWYVYGNQNPVVYGDYTGFKAKGIVYSIGASNDDIKLLQIMLNAKGYGDANGNRLVEDGIFGVNTKYAVERFQLANGLAVDGLVGDITWVKLGYTLSESLPYNGNPNSTGRLYNPDGSIKQERVYGDDGSPKYDDDYNHAGDGHGVGFPHRHTWKDGIRAKEPIPVPENSNIEKLGAFILGGIATLFELGASYYGIPMDIPGN